MGVELESELSLEFSTWKVAKFAKLANENINDNNTKFDVGVA